MDKILESIKEFKGHKFEKLNHFQGKNQNWNKNMGKQTLDRS